MGFRLFDQRRNFVVNPKMQRQIILSAAWPLVVIIGVMVLVQFVLDAQLAAVLQQHQLVLEGRSLRVIAGLGFMGFALAYVGVMSLKLSHRVAGAAWRLGQTMKSFREGERQVRAKLRDDDFLLDLQGNLNEFLAWAEEALAERPSPARPDVQRTLVVSPEATPPRPKADSRT
ncbi:MAG: hypothetical protein ACRDGR_01785 [bacterium]